MFLLSLTEQVWISFAWSSETPSKLRSDVNAISNLNLFIAHDKIKYASS